MQRTVLFLFTLLTIPSLATTWEVDAGGGPDLGTPYFAPQLLTIAVGDVVQWNWVSGQHNVAATSGPESFNSDTHNAPFTWSFTFTLVGEYHYECSISNHANTQFGTITVTPLAVANISGGTSLDFVMYPNPSGGLLCIEREVSIPVEIVITDLTGNVVLSENNIADLRRNYDLASFGKGIYFVEMRLDSQVNRRRLILV